MSYYVYIMTNHLTTVLYIGATNNLERRIYEHKKKLVDGFTKKYNLDRLVYFKETNDVLSALEREKQFEGLAPAPEGRARRDDEPSMAGLKC